jgi:hypothetical protein
VPGGSVQRIPPVLLYGGPPTETECMKTLYKYYSSSFDIKHHLKSPEIKLSHVNSFNDPFESKISDIHAARLADLIMARTNTSDETTKNDFIHSYKMVNNIFGVISLTETHRNLLMWSHYASSHKGVCVGYEVDFFEKLEKDEFNVMPNLKAIKYLPERVIYDSKRFDLDQQINTSDSLDSIINAMMKKSDEWIYEKEHRCIVPFSWADKFIINNNCPETEKEKIIKSLFDDKNPNDNECYFFKNNDNANPCELARNGNITILKKINTDSINSIYLGSNYSFNETCNIKMMMESSPDKYGHIRLYKYEINSNDFSLDALPLSNVKLNYELDEKTKDRIAKYCI